MTTTKPKKTMSADEMIGSLTGFEENAITERFGMDWGELTATKPTMFARALVFAYKSREMPTEDAYQAAMSMGLREADSFFTASEPQIDGVEPVSESGKDSTEPE